MADGIVAFTDIQANLTTDPARAGEALLAFLKTPIAANNLISPPFDLSTIDEAARIAAAPASIPACLDTSGTTGCDRIDTKKIPMPMTCDAGPLSFTGSASRTCSPCADLTGSCAYNWDLDIKFTSPGFTLTSNTQGPTPGGITLNALNISVNAQFKFDYQTGGTTTSGFLRINTCGTGTITAGPPKRLANAVFTVHHLDAGGTPTNRCVVVRFSAAGTPSISSVQKGCPCP